MKRTIKCILLTAFCLWLLPFHTYAAQELIPVGKVVGLELRDGSVTIASFDEQLGQTCQKAGVKAGDVLVSIDGMPIHGAQDVRAALAKSDGSVTLEVRRDGKQKKVKVTPQITQDGPKLGVYLRQGVTGIGTVTWYDPQEQTFATLGHGVNGTNGKLLSMKEGSAYEARVLAVRKGKSGQPGQLMGSVERMESVGALTKNTNQGVFGKTNLSWEGQTIPVAQPKEVKTGAATILSTISGTQVREYSVEILKIYPTSRHSGRNMLIHVTDPELLATTGGIVQGMSGSPIIQDGKLVGAVTHVLVNDPTTGYGIFIENMLDAAA